MQAAEPTKATLQIWTPLLDHLAQYEPSFVNTLVEQLFNLVQTGIKGKASEVASIKWSAVVWILHLWSDRRGPTAISEEVKSSIRRSTLSALVQEEEMYVYPLHSRPMSSR